MGIVFGNKADVPFKIGTKNELIAESIARIILTIPGERPGNLTFGSNVRAFLFENDLLEVKSLIELELLAVLEVQEPRVTLTKIVLTEVSDDLRSMVLALEFVIKNEPGQPKLLFIPLVA